MQDPVTHRSLDFHVNLERGTVVSLVTLVDSYSHRRLQLTVAHAATPCLCLTMTGPRNSGVHHLHKAPELYDC